ncbi:MAG TPA: VCBS repeat-containing protein [bacterium]|nr:VCBS repeat-containing protein [bacterium]
MRWLKWILLLLCCLALFACGDDDDPSTSSGQADDDNDDAGDDDGDDDDDDESDDDTTDDDDATPLVYGDDLVYSGDDGLRALLNDGKGYGEPVVLDADIRADDIAVADFDDDGHTDIVLSSFQGIDVLFNQGNGVQYKKVNNINLHFPDGFVAADFTGDGILDLAGYSFYHKKVYLYAHDGAGHFTETEIVDLSEYSVVSMIAADFNNDGRPDLALGAKKYLYIYTNNGDGTFERSERFSGYYVSFWFESLAAHDLNGDGNLDVIATFSHGELYILHGNGDGTLTEAEAMEIETDYLNLLVAADYDRDGNLDLVIGYGYGSVGILHGRSDGTFRQPDFLFGSEGNLFLAVAQINNDDYPDLIVAYEDWETKGPSPYQHMGVLPGKGELGFGPLTRLDENVELIRVADLDGQ